MRWLLAFVCCLSGMASAAEDVVVEDFEGDDYGKWSASGYAFGKGPARGTLANQMAVSGFEGSGLVNSYVGGDGSKGKLVGPEFKITRAFLNFLIGGGAHPEQTYVQLMVDGTAVRSATGRNDERLDWFSWDVSELKGKKARLEIVDTSAEGWGHINVDQFVLSDERRAELVRAETLYDETYRPQFHFSPKKNWTNDPNGLVYYGGVYHLFFQHNPSGINWGNMTWGHATSPDLLHWTEHEPAIYPDELGTIFSGSAVVDWQNTSGLKAGDADVLCAFYTAAGKPFTQCLAYSTDRGVTWTKYAHNPILGHVAGDNRDPKVFWHGPTSKWVMALYLKDNDFAFYGSQDLKRWTQLSTLTVPESGECPDLFELTVNGNAADTRWVFLGGDGNYLIGQFDGERFVKESGKFIADYGKNYYATQSYSDIPEEDGRRIQIAWMRGGAYPGMPFNQQMSIPCVLTLRRFPEGLRMCRNPIGEIEALRGAPRTWDAVAVSGTLPLEGCDGELLDITLDLAPGDAAACGLMVRGEALRYDAAAKELSCLGAKAPVAPVDGRIALRILVDRTTIEVFAQGGKLVMSNCFLPRQKDRTLALFSEGGTARAEAVKVYPLKSTWFPER